MSEREAPLPDIDIDIDTHPDLREKMWLASRIGWLVMLAIVVAAVFGLTGSGGSMAHQRIAAGRATIDLPRFSRWAASDELSVEFDPAQSGAITVRIPEPFLRSFTIEGVTPQPASVRATPNGHEFVFELAAEPGEKTARFAIRASSPSPPAKMGHFAIGETQSRSATVVILP